MTEEGSVLALATDDQNTPLAISFNHSTKQIEKIGLDKLHSLQFNDTSAVNYD